MTFEMTAEVVLRKDGRPVLDAIGCSLLEAVRDLGQVSAIAKRRGMSVGDLAGGIAAINRQFDRPVVNFDGDEYSLTSEAADAISEFRLKEHLLQEQLHNLWRKPWITTDGVVLIDGRLVLIRRGREPFKGMYALPGGIVDYGESLEDCIIREMREETGLDVEIVGIGGVYSKPDRDPRGHFITVSFNLRCIGGTLRGGDDAADASLFDLNALPTLAADHAQIVADALKARDIGKR
jgi:8-oxo-dGTP diphosphatase